MSQTSHPDSTKIPSELEKEIDAVRENLRQLVEQAAGYSGAADDDLTSNRIAEQEARLALLVKEYDARNSRET